MTNKNVIEIINRLMDPNATKIAGTASEMFTAIIHGYYYIRPGKSTFRFIERINKILKTNWKDRPKMYVETKDGLPFEAYLWGKMAGEALFVARSMFDEEYYSSQIERMVAHETYDEHLLERYMYWLNDEELKSVFEGLVVFKRDYDVFISDENFDRMTEELEEKAISVVQNSPCYAMDYDAHIDCIYNTWDGVFAYLCRESIIDTICRYIDEDPVMFANMIKTFKYTDTRTAAEYTGLAISLAYGYELDIFDPVMIETQDVEDSDDEQVWQMRTRSVGKIKVGVKSV